MRALIVVLALLFATTPCLSQNMQDLDTFMQELTSVATARKGDASKFEVFFLNELWVDKNPKFREERCRIAKFLASHFEDKENEVSQQQSWIDKYSQMFGRFFFVVRRLLPVREEYERSVFANRQTAARFTEVLRLRCSGS